MNEIIKKAIEGGWNNYKKHNISFEKLYYGEKPTENEIILDYLFWQALGRTCGWTKFTFGRHKGDAWLVAATRFHKINLTEGWEAAVAYLEEVTK